MKTTNSNTLFVAGRVVRGEIRIIYENPLAASTNEPAVRGDAT